MTAKKTTAKPQAKTAEATSPTSDQSYLDEFYAANGQRGFEYLAELPYTGERAADRELVVAALADAARASATVAAIDDAEKDAAPERGFIAYPDDTQFKQAYAELHEEGAQQGEVLEITTVVPAPEVDADGKPVTDENGQS